MRVHDLKISEVLDEYINDDPQSRRDVLTSSHYVWPQAITFGAKARTLRPHHF